MTVAPSQSAVGVGRACAVDVPPLTHRSSSLIAIVIVLMSRAVDSPAPLFVLRGHRAAIHTITITSRHRRHTEHTDEAKGRHTASLRSPSAGGRLYSGDATGVVMVWDLSTRRSIARFHAHNTAPILAIHEIGDGKIITSTHTP